MAAAVPPGSTSRRTKVGRNAKASDLVGPTEPSAALLAQVAAIRESAERCRGEDVSGSESEEEEDLESSDLFKKTLKMYYRDLGSADGKGGKSAALLPSLPSLPCLQLVIPPLPPSLPLSLPPSLPPSFQAQR